MPTYQELLYDQGLENCSHCMFDIYTFGIVVLESFLGAGAHDPIEYE